MREIAYNTDFFSPAVRAITDLYCMFDILVESRSEVK